MVARPSPKHMIPPYCIACAEIKAAERKAEHDINVAYGNQRKAIFDRKQRAWRQHEFGKHPLNDHPECTPCCVYVGICVDAAFSYLHEQPEIPRALR